MTKIWYDKDSKRLRCDDPWCPVCGDIIIKTIGLIIVVFIIIDYILSKYALW